MGWPGENRRAVKTLDCFPTMNTKQILTNSMIAYGSVLALLPSFAGTLHASPRTSTNYSITTDTLDAGGRRTTSASYTNDGSAGGIVGISSVAAPAEMAKHGYIAQFSEPTGLSIPAASPTVNETSTDLLGAWLALDDATFAAVPATGVAWSVLSGPLVSINGSGLATAGTVYQNTAATAQGIYSGFTGALSITVIESIPDNFGSYAGDGLGDDWQVQYFGQNNPNAGPLRDPDSDGQTNAFEFTAGLVPTDPASRFTLSIAVVPGQSGQKKLIFSPRLAGRTYTVKAKASLLPGTYLPLTNPSAPSDDGETRTIIDRDASGATKFYQVEIVKP